MKLTIFDPDNWREIGATLARNKTRTFLTAFGIFWGTAMLAMLHGGATGLSGYMLREVQGMATNLGGMFPNQTSMPYKGYNKGLRWSFNWKDYQSINANVPKIDKLAPVIMRSDRVAFNDKQKSANVQGVVPDFFDIQTVKLLAGRALNASDLHGRTKNILIGQNISSEFFGADPTYAIGKSIIIGNQAFTVVGVGKQLSDASLMGRVDDCTYIPITTMMGTYNTGTRIDGIMFTARPGYKPSEIFQDVRRIVSCNHPVHPDDTKAFMEFDISDMFERISGIFTGIDLLALFVGFGTLIAGIIGVGNIMWIIVRERTTEIGIRRAIGAKPRDVIAQVLSESMVLTTVAGTAGICFAAMVLGIADMVTASPDLGHAGFQLTFAASLTILALFLVLGTIAGLIPAIRAMRIKPVEAMRGK